jgi:hypothetical protein
LLPVDGQFGSYSTKQSRRPVVDTPSHVQKTLRRGGLELIFQVVPDGCSDFEIHVIPEQVRAST